MSEPHAGRFEFRAFARDFGITEIRMRERSDRPRIRESAEVYVLSRNESDHNVKIRSDTLDIKKLIGERDDLEQWLPVVKEDFPLKASVLQDTVFPALNVIPEEMLREAYTARQLIEDLVMSNAELTAVVVFKTRFGFLIDDCPCEIARVQVNGADIMTASVESTDPERVTRLIAELCLSPWENTSYPVALKRITGLLPVPLPL